MTLIRPLVTSLVKSNVSSIGGGGGGFPSDATLEHYYPFASNLTDSITGDIGTLTRASTSTVTDINTGNPITYGVDQPAFNGVGGTGDAIGLGFGASPDDFQLDSSTWPANNYVFYAVIQDWANIASASPAVVMQNRNSANNQWIIRNDSMGAGDVSFFNAVSGVTKVVTAPLLGNTSFDFIIDVDSTLGTSITTDFGSDIDSTMTSGVAIPQPVTQVGNGVALTTPSNLYLSQFKIIEKPAGTSITLEQARNKT